MDTFPEFKDLPPRPPVATASDYGTLYLAGEGGDSGLGGGDVHQ